MTANENLRAMRETVSEVPDTCDPVSQDHSGYDRVDGYVQWFPASGLRP